MILSDSLIVGVLSGMYPESTIQLALKFFLGMFYIPQMSLFLSFFEYKEGLFILSFPVVFAFDLTVLWEVTD